MKALLLKTANVLAVIWQLIPARFRHLYLKGLFVLESRGDARNGLKNLFAIQDDLEHVVNERALVSGDGVHPKHRLTRYHDFFIERISDKDSVLDVGCGYGAVARSIARAYPSIKVVGVDYDKGRLGQARASDNPPNLSFVESDATKSVPEGPWTVIVLSNVFEHITDRPGFLSALIATTGAQRFLIRVPHFERDWKMPMRKELGVNYYSDPDHKVEHTRAEFRADVEKAGLELDELLTLWGEIWSSLSVAKRR
ncbi:class I SAM-dependent methyltransferase [Hyphomicrobium sp.]|uniref:class I SAM-dependent methyltransferase n=1 Tax=Hyphomicrobium sp. TaxID=82 RepID=UPI0025C06C17|nr:class I SAM-dependent methyltransferase [Hyphomicrobium sp.]MCC7252922.1 class I SAM-dependent methyltransferase [Hyphomicrobium sp.]